MREYHKQMDDRMFDFQNFYRRLAYDMRPDSVIAEVGIADGASAIFMAETLVNLGTPFKFWLIDSLAYGGADQLHTILRNLTLAQLELGDSVEILPIDSLNASCRFPDGHFDLVFIDASHKYEQTKADILLWQRKVKLDGFLAGHDYNDGEGAEVKQAVDEILATPRNGWPLQIEETPKGHNVWWAQRTETV